jgi:hypothetical protein
VNELHRHLVEEAVEESDVVGSGAANAAWGETPAWFRKHPA